MSAAPHARKRGQHAKIDFGRAVSRFLSAFLRTERIICLSSQYPKPVPRTEPGAGNSSVSYLALHPMGFSVPPRLLLERWAFTPPFHPYRRLAPTAVYFLWHYPSKGFKPSPACIPGQTGVTRHRALRSSDFPPPACAGSDPPPFQNHPHPTTHKPSKQAAAYRQPVNFPVLKTAQSRKTHILPWTGAASLNNLGNNL